MYKILAIGDSVTWGQGLKSEDKFAHRVGAALTQQTNAGPVQVDILAHSGAVLKREKDRDAHPDPYLMGELPRAHPDILTQAMIAKSSTPENRRYLADQPYDFASHRQHKHDILAHVAEYDAKDPDLIIVGGGINDFDAFQILLPFESARLASIDFKEANGIFDLAAIGRELRTLVDSAGFSEKEFRALVRASFKPMKDHLVSLKSASLFPNSRIIVTGYYPLFTEESKLAPIGAFAAVLYFFARLGLCRQPMQQISADILFLLAELLGKSFFVERSKLFVDCSNEFLKEAVADANRELGAEHIFFAPAGFGSHGAFSDDTFIFGFKFIDIKSARDIEVIDVDDAREADRKAAWELAFKHGKVDADSKFMAFHAAIGHPNVKGARQYAAQIMDVIRRHPRAFNVAFHS